MLPTAQLLLQNSIFCNAVLHNQLIQLPQLPQLPIQLLQQLLQMEL
jgi:hypothetical protein